MIDSAAVAVSDVALCMVGVLLVVYALQTPWQAARGTTPEQRAPITIEINHAGVCSSGIGWKHEYAWPAFVGAARTRHFWLLARRTGGPALAVPRWALTAEEDRACEVHLTEHKLLLLGGPVPVGQQAGTVVTGERTVRPARPPDPSDVTARPASST